MTNVETTNLPEILAEVSEGALPLMEVAVEAKPEDGTDAKFEDLFQMSAVMTDLKLATGQRPTFIDMFTEGFFAAASSRNDEMLRQALVGTAALLVTWVDTIDRRQPSKPAEPKAIAA